MNFGRIRIVVLRTRHGKNLGGVARALNNFGLPSLVLADLGDVDWTDARQMAVRSTHILEQAKRSPDLRSAVEGCTWVVGTTMRAIPGSRALTPQEVAREMAARSDEEDLALVFGEERVGLTNRDLLHCHDISVIPTTAALPSLNLAQAVMIYAWELFRAGPAPSRPQSKRAEEGAYERIDRALRDLVEIVGFAEPDRPRHGVLDLMHTLKRSGLTPREARLWEAVLRRARLHR